MTWRLVLIGAPLIGVVSGYMQDHHRQWWLQVLVIIPIVFAVVWPSAEHESDDERPDRCAR